jgi:NAD(P)-dependent dehydrogenase (short-subunit alcohol dehydrogenase family)
MSQWFRPVVLITGSTDGLGRKVADSLAAKGAAVLLHGRNLDKGRALLDAITSTTGNPDVQYYNADFASLADVRSMAERIMRDHKLINVLINNAGIGFGRRGGERREVSEDGYELRFAVNYLAHVELTRKLLPLLKGAAAQTGEARIVNVSSAGQQSIDFNNVMLEREYNGVRAYCQSKLAQVMFTMDLAEELAGSGVTVTALHPATYMNTGMVIEAGIRPISTVEEGAGAVEFLATSEKMRGVSGEYFDHTRRSRANAQAYDRKARAQLRELTDRLLGSTT